MALGLALLTRSLRGRPAMSNSFVFVVQIDDVFAEKWRIESCRAPAVALLYGPAQIEMRRSTTFSRRRGGSPPAELQQWLCFMVLRISTTMRRSTTSSRREGGSLPAELDVVLLDGSAQSDSDAQINAVFAGKKRIASCRAPAVALPFGSAQNC